MSENKTRIIDKDRWKDSEGWCETYCNALSLYRFAMSQATLDKAIIPIDCFVLSGDETILRVETQAFLEKLVHAYYTYRLEQNPHPVGGLELVSKVVSIPNGNLSLATLRTGNIRRLPEFKNAKGDFAHSHADGSDWLLSAWCNATFGELGEAANLIKKIERGDYDLAEVRTMLADELADVLTYLDLLAYRAGINLSDATIKKWNRISMRINSNLRITEDD